MKNAPRLIVMLTYEDLTVENAEEIFEALKDCPASYFGMKEAPLPPDTLRRIFSRMKDAGKTTVLEVVAYTEEECLRGARVAAECGCDLLMGTLFFDSVSDFCRERGLKYMPFVGEVSGRPSVLGGSAEDMIAEAKTVLEKGAWGIDLLGYRYDGDAGALIRRVVRETPGPVCVAGSVNSFERLDDLAEAGPWAFTIGSAFFTGDYHPDLPTAVRIVSEYMEKAAGDCDA